MNSGNKKITGNEDKFFYGVIVDQVVEKDCLKNSSLVEKDCLRSSILIGQVNELSDSIEYLDPCVFSINIYTIALNKENKNFGIMGSYSIRNEKILFPQSKGIHYCVLENRRKIISKTTSKPYSSFKINNLEGLLYTMEESIELKSNNFGIIRGKIRRANEHEEPLTPEDEDDLALRVFGVNIGLIWGNYLKNNLDKIGNNSEQFKEITNPLPEKYSRYEITDLFNL